MAKPLYKVKGSFFDNMQMHLDGAEVEYLYEPGENLDPLNAEAKEAKKRVGKVVPSKPLDAAERAELETLRADKAEREKA